jgi:hypothetical protein
VTGVKTQFRDPGRAKLRPSLFFFPGRAKLPLSLFIPWRAKLPLSFFFIPGRAKLPLSLLIAWRTKLPLNFLVPWRAKLLLSLLLSRGFNRIGRMGSLRNDQLDGSLFSRDRRPRKPIRVSLAHHGRTFNSP